VASGQLAEAVTAARAQIARSSADAVAWKWLGLALRQLGKTAEATEALERCLTLDDSDLEAAMALAELQHQQGRTDAALSLVQFILLAERNAPDLRRRAQSLKTSLSPTRANP
jgi:tetratricopeptide (TPR) repeat protein